LTPLYERNFPETRFIPLALASDSDPEQAKRAARAMGVSSGEVDVLLAGPPCQTLSQAGKREDHEANRLLICVCDLARFLRPKVVVIENVPEFGRIQDGRLLGRVRVQLALAGYATDVLTLNATTFGVPQARVRCFVIGVLRGLAGGDSLARFRPVPTHVTIPSASVRVSTVGVTRVQ